MDDAQRRLLDEDAIRRVIDCYCHYVDRGTADEVAELFHPEGRLLATWEDDGIYKGRDAVRAWYANYHAEFRSRLSHLRHKISNVLIEWEGDEARVVSYLDADAIFDGDAERQFAVGRYDDRFVRDGDRWCFGERAILIYDVSKKLADAL